MEHKWNKSIPRSDGYYEGYACEECSALITPDGIIVETPDISWEELLFTIALVIFFGAVIWLNT